MNPIGRFRCPKCGRFTLKEVFPENKPEGLYVCTSCGEHFEAKEVFAFSEDQIQQFPGNDPQPSSPLADQMKRKKPWNE